MNRSGLDPSQMVEIREMLKALSDDTSILLSTHLLAEAERMCTHHIILHEEESHCQVLCLNLVRQRR